MRKSILAVAALGGLLSGCNGYNFVPVSVNSVALPNDFKNRTVIANSIDFRLNPSSYIGEIITPDTNGAYKIINAPILKAGTSPIEEAFKTGDVYHDMIDKSANASGNYLALFTANLTATQTMTIDITDAIHAYAKPADYPSDQLFAIAATPSTVHRYWLAELYISAVSTNIADSIGASTTITAPAFGVKGGVNQNSSVTSHDYSVAAKLIDIDDYARLNGKPSGGPPPVPVPPNAVGDKSYHGAGVQFATLGVITVKKE